MPQTNFYLETFAPVDADFAFRILSDLTNHMGTNPFFQKVDEVNSYINTQGQPVKDLRVSERPYLWFIRYTTSFHVRQTFIDNRSMLFEVNAAFGTRLKNRWEFHPEGDGVRIHEYVTIDAPALTLDYIHKQAHYSHTKTFEGLPALLAEKADLLSQEP